MEGQTLHILNGDSLTPRLKKLNITEDQFVWREMLCEGKTVYNLISKEFQIARVSYLKQFDTTPTIYKQSFLIPLLTADFAMYDHIILWFEYDLFCHINMIAALSHLKNLKVTGNIYLVCSGHTEKDDELKGLGELTDQQLLKHYKNKIVLTQEDIMLADELWRLYCHHDHTFFQEYLHTKSSFPYLSSSIAAHLKRFPDVTTGLNVLEANVLEIIQKYKVKSVHQLIGYVLKYQGYYGFGDLQIKNIIHKLAPFFENDNGKFVLTRKGHLAFEHLKNYEDILTDDTTYGGCKKYNYCYHPTSRIVTKHE